MIMKRLKNSRMIKLFLHYTSILLPFFIISCNTSVIDNYEKSVLFCEKYGNDDFSLYEGVYIWFRGKENKYDSYVLQMPISDSNALLLNILYRDSIDYKIISDTKYKFDTCKIITMINRFKIYGLYELRYWKHNGNLYLNFTEEHSTLIRFKDEEEKNKVQSKLPKMVKILDLWFYLK